MARWLCLAVVCCALIAVGAENCGARYCSKKTKKCPPPGFDAVKDFDPATFISRSWYVQEQTVVAFQAIDTFYCAAATYEPLNETDILQGLRVYNYANRGKVNGVQMGTSGSGGEATLLSNLDAVVPDPEQPSKLLVGLTVVRSWVPDKSLKWFFGDYWVVAVGEDDEGGYKWAIISAGAPEVESDEGCKTGTDLLSQFRINGVGLWLFARDPVDPESTTEMRSIAKDLGFDISGLYPVEQEGCKYDGAVLK